MELEEDSLHDLTVDIAAGEAVGVNGIDVESAAARGDRIELKIGSPFRWSRRPVAAFLRVPPGRRFALFTNGQDAGSYSSAELGKGVALPVSFPRAR